MAESYKNCLLVITLCMILFPPAKINLGLNVLKKRSDGYHEIDTCMVTIPVTDVLEILPSENFYFTQTGLTIEGDQSDNLVVKAFNLMKQEYAIGNVYIHLLKNIPMGAGLGGGSADATCTILALNDLFKLGLSNDTMRELAAHLGSDCSFFVENKAQIGQGRGELLSPVEVNLAGLYLKIINPSIHIGTSEAYSNLELNKEFESIRETISIPIIEWKDRLKNSFELSVFKNHSRIKEIKDSLYAEGAVYVSMTGSGSTVYALYNAEPALTFQSDYERVIRL